MNNNSTLHKFLMWATRARPCKHIEVNGPYLERYYMGGLFGFQVWLHRFRSADAERHLHTHPWRAVSVVLAGGYQEETRSFDVPMFRWRRAWGLPAVIGPRRLHRIATAAPDTWTLMIVGRQRLTGWHFLDDDGTRVPMPASSRTWWRHYGPREAA